MENAGQKFFKKTSYCKNDSEPIEINEPKANEPKTIGDPIELNKPILNSQLEKIVAKRRSKRDFTEKPMTMDQLSRILWLTQGITGEIGKAKLRAVASAGNRHPFNNYVLVNNVEGLDKGIYLYEPLKETISLVVDGDKIEIFRDACGGQKLISSCQICYIQTAVTARTTDRYRERGYRYIFIDVGHIGAQTQLVCEDMGLGSCNVGAFMDDAVSEILHLKSEYEIPVYITVIGDPSK